MFERREDLVSVICSIAKHPVHRMLLAAVLLDLIEQRDEHPVVRQGFVGDLQAEDLVGLDIDYGMDFQPPPVDLPLLAHPFAPVGDLDPGTVDGDDAILGEELGCYGEREIQALDPAEEGGIVCCREAGDECRELPDKPLHLAIGHLQEDMDASHPRGERFGILERPTALASIHLGKQIVPLLDEVKREIEFSAPHHTQTLIYTLGNPVDTNMTRSLRTGKHQTEWITISVDEYKSMCRTIEVLSDPDLMQQIEEGKKKGTKVQDFEEVARELGI